MGKIINSVFLVLLLVVGFLVLSGFLVNEVWDQSLKLKEQGEEIERLNRVIYEKDQKIGDQQAEIGSLQYTIQTYGAKVDELTGTVDALRQELTLKDAELKAAQQELFQAAAELAATKQNWQKTIAALIKTWQDYEQAKNELGDSQKMLEVAVQQLVQARQERDVLRYQVKVMTITTGEPKTEFNGILPVIYVANLLVLFPALRSVLKINQ